MEESIELSEDCTKCNTIILQDQKFCRNCGYPYRGTVSEKAKFNAEQVQLHYKSKEAPRLIRKARNTLFVIAGITFLAGVFYVLFQDDIVSLIVSTILALIYLLLGYWSQKKPLMALVLALFVYLTVIVINAIIMPESIYKGIIIKVIIIVFLAKGISSSLHLRKTN